MIATFYPLQHLAQRVVGDRFQVTSLVPPGVEPHDWEPTPRGIAAIKKAKVFIYQGAGLETWADRTVATLGREGPVVVKATTGLSLRSVAEEPAKHRTPGTAKEPPLDPHVWLDPQLYGQQAAAVRDALAKADPDGEAVYTANLASLKMELDELNDEMKLGLSNCERRTFVTAHAAFAYLADRFELKQVAISGISGESEPSPARLRGIVQRVRQEGATHIFFETLASPAVSETVAKEVGAQTLVLNPIEGLSTEEVKAGADYFSVQRQNLANLRIALDCS